MTDRRDSRWRPGPMWGTLLAALTLAAAHLRAAPPRAERDEIAEQTLRALGEAVNAPRRPRRRQTGYAAEAPRTPRPNEAPRRADGYAAEAPRPRRAKIRRPQPAITTTREVAEKRSIVERPLASRQPPEASPWTARGQRSEQPRPAPLSTAAAARATVRWAHSQPDDPKPVRAAAGWIDASTVRPTRPGPAGSFNPLRRQSNDEASTRSLNPLRP